MQMLTTKSETLRMKDSETINEFYVKLCDLSNQVFDLGEEYSNSNLVRKVLRSLSERFFVKVTAIEKVKYLKCLRIDESIGSLQNFELNLDEPKKVKSKEESNIALQVADEMPIPNALTIKELQVQIALLTQNFNKAFKK
ncbi:hypothetical protein Golax_023834 [Gossypium laxum]|uniref:Gag-pol polyprotein n=1 Tax=Gossypium laxum TaxID=34288 RepID=A0A7J8ZBV9_9ROSI|nr:hypothetical protein [Gossypium laxum]